MGHERVDYITIIHMILVKTRLTFGISRGALFAPAAGCHC
jgi:hypothetical protein